MNSATIRPAVSARAPDTVLLLEEDVVVRAFIAEYLRSCGYRVLETRSTEEALSVLQESSLPIRAVLSGAESGFRLAGWVKAHRPKIKIILAATAERAARAAAGLCDSGPHRKRPYDPQLLVQQIRAGLAKGLD